MTESEIKRLATFVGGQVKDLDTVITGLLRGYTPSRTHRFTNIARSDLIGILYNFIIILSPNLCAVSVSDPG